MNTFKVRCLDIVFLLLISAALAGCSGKGGPDASKSAPAAPTGVTALSGDGQVTIAWTAVPGATSYNIYWSNNAGVTTANGTKITGAPNPDVINGLTNGTSYYYLVTAVNANGESTATPPFSGVGGSAELTTAPPAPTGVTAKPGDGQVTIAWTAVPGASSYNIYWSTTAGVTTSNGTKITGAPNPDILKGLTNGTSYYYLVTAVNSKGESAAATPTLLPSATGP
jgi:fibronectin type 3 domain-containing protein